MGIWEWLCAGPAPGRRAIAQRPGAAVWKTLVVCALGVALASGQTLRMRSAVESTELKKVYEAPEYEACYKAAEKSYVDARSTMAFVPVAWNGNKALMWLIQSQRQLLAYSKAFADLKRDLSVAANDPPVRNNVEKVARLSLIEDRLTKDNLETLNELIQSVDLGSFFLGNHKPNMAKMWSPRRVPESARMLDQNKMTEVEAALDDVNICLARSGELHVQFAKTASFSADVPVDENDTPLTRQQAEIFWQAYTHPPLDKAIAGLYESLGKAKALMKAVDATLVSTVPERETTQVAPSH